MIAGPVPAANSRETRTPRSPSAVLRGLAAVAALFAGAADALVTAWLGIPRLGWLARRAGEEAGTAYRRGAWGAVDEPPVDADITGVADDTDVPGERRETTQQEGGADGQNS